MLDLSPGGPPSIRLSLSNTYKCNICCRIIEFSSSFLLDNDPLNRVTSTIQIKFAMSRSISKKKSSKNLSPEVSEIQTGRELKCYILCKNNCYL